MPAGRAGWNDLRSNPNPAAGWSDFALLCVFIALLIIVAAYVRAIWVNFSYVNLARALAILLACCWLLAASVVASEKYLGWTMPDGETRPGLGWHARVRHAIWTWGNWLVRLLGVKPALVIGAALALLSLTLAVGDDWLDDNNSGYNVVAGKAVWPMAFQFGLTKLEFLLTQGYRAVYVLGLLVAALALMGVVPGRLGRSIRSSWILPTLAGAIALLQVTHVAMVPAADKYPLALSILIWAVPLALWLRGDRGRENWNHTRVAVAVFYFPVFRLGIAFLVFFTSCLVRLARTLLSAPQENSFQYLTMKNSSTSRPLYEVDPRIANAIDSEVRRQHEGLELITSENFVSEAVLEPIFDSD